MNCKNCGHHVEEWQNFCGNCGAKVIRNRLSPRILAEQVNQEILAIDNRLFRTFYALFRAPEDVIVGYINGVRKKYQDVLQYFAIALTLTGFQVFIISVFFPEAFEYSNELTESLRSAPGSENNPFLDISMEDSTNYQGLTYIVLLPFQAISSWLAYALVGDKRFNLTEHFVITLYYTAQIIFINAVLILLLVIMGFDYVKSSLILLIPIYIYYVVVLKRTFNDTYLVAFGKFLIVQVINIFVFAFLGALVAIGGVIYGYFFA